MYRDIPSYFIAFIYQGISVPILYLDFILPNMMFENVREGGETWGSWLSKLREQVRSAQLEYDITY